MEYKKISEINTYVGKNINPSNVSEEVFEMYSVPSFDSQYPEIIKGEEIGSSKQIVKKDDILLCKINPRINRVWIVSEFTDNKQIASSEWIVIRSNEMYARYLMWYFRSDYFRTLMTSNVTGMGGSLMRAQPKQVQEYLVPVMSYDNQKRIANILDKAQELIDKRKEQIEALDELVKSRFIDMFGDIKNNNKKYQIIKIGDCAKLQGGYAFKSKDFVEDGIKLVQISNVNKDTLDWDTINYLPYDYLEKYKNYSLKLGDVVMAMTRPIIKSLNAVKIAFITNNDIPCLLNQRVGRFLIDSKNINPIYLVEVCKSSYFKDYVERMSGNSLQPNVSSKQIEDLEIPLPPIELQNQFADFVNQVDKLKSQMETSLKELEDNFNSLMQKAFKGELF